MPLARPQPCPQRANPPRSVPRANRLRFRELPATRRRNDYGQAKSRRQRLDASFLIQTNASRPRKTPPPRVHKAAPLATGVAATCRRLPRHRVTGAACPSVVRCLRRKADIAAVQRAADLPKSRRRLSAMANSLADNAMSTSGLVLAPNRQMNAQRKPPEVRDTSKGKSAVYSRETLRGRASAKPSASPGSLTPGPAMPTSADFRSGGSQPLFLDAGRRKSRGTTPKTSQVSGEKPSATAKGAAYLADTKAEPASGSAVQAGRRDSGVSAVGAGQADSSRGLAEGQSPPAAQGQGHQPPAGSSGAVLVKEPAAGCCAVM